MIRITQTVTNANPNTIYAKLAAKLGRDPTRAEIVADIRRILQEGAQERLEGNGKRK